MSETRLKALIIQKASDSDLGDIIQIARAEGMKIFRNPQKIRVLDVIPYRLGYIAVVQNGDGCISEKKNMIE